jgi:hypothetical protein
MRSVGLTNGDCRYRGSTLDQRRQMILARDDLSEWHSQFPLDRVQALLVLLDDLVEVLLDVLVPPLLQDQVETCRAIEIENPGSTIKMAGSVKQHALCFRLSKAS